MFQPHPGAQRQTAHPRSSQAPPADNNITVGPNSSVSLPSAVVEGEQTLDATKVVDATCLENFAHTTTPLAGSGTITLTAVEADAETGGGQIAGSFADEAGVLSRTFDVTMLRP